MTTPETEELAHIAVIMDEHDSDETLEPSLRLAAVKKRACRRAPVRRIRRPHHHGACRRGVQDRAR